MSTHGASSNSGRHLPTVDELISPQPALNPNISNILQREHDRAKSLLESSPFLASLFMTYATAATKINESGGSVDQFNSLESSYQRLQEDFERLRVEHETFRAEAHRSKAEDELELDQLRSANRELQDELSMAVMLNQAGISEGGYEKTSKAEQQHTAARIRNELESLRADNKAAHETIRELRERSTPQEALTELASLRTALADTKTRNAAQMTLIYAQRKEEDVKGTPAAAPAGTVEVEQCCANLCALFQAPNENLDSSRRGLSEFAEKVEEIMSNRSIGKKSTKRLLSLRHALEEECWLKAVGGGGNQANLRPGLDNPWK